MKPVTTLLTSTSMNYELGPPVLRPPDGSDDPLAMIIQEIGKALDAKLFYAAVSVTLSLPDICSALEIDYGHSRFKDIAKRYQNWFEKYVEKRFKNFKAIDCWALRGGALHNAMLSNHPSNKRGRIVLMPPNSLNIIIHEMEVQNCGPDRSISGFQLYIPAFCEAMIQSAEEWWQEKKDDPIVEKNAPDLVRYRPEGLAGFMSGIPVIA